jgi:hypothetical protein
VLWSDFGGFWWVLVGSSGFWWVLVVWCVQVVLVGSEKFGVSWWVQVVLIILVESGGF